MNIRVKCTAIAVAGLLLCGCDADDQLLPVVEQAKYQISGRIIGLYETPTSGITVKAGTFTAVTDSSGRFVIPYVPNGRYVITPEVKNLALRPASRTADVSGGNVNGQDFEAGYSLQQDMKIIAGGSFSMGSIMGDNAERPVRIVTISTFAMGKYEVTQSKWKAIMGTNPSNFIGDSLPVEKVSWHDAVAFCNALSLQEGLTPTYTIIGKNTTCDFNANGYRLPTEAEWEYACRAGTTTDYYSGNRTSSSKADYFDAKLDEIGWYLNNSDSTTHIVGQKRPNNFGLFDITGNVFEWCWDYATINYDGLSQTNPTGPTNGGSRICRGGSCFYVPYKSRSAFRLSYAPESMFSGVGFRVVRSIF